MPGVQAIIFDLDGVLIDSEEAWDQARRDLVAETGGTWRDGATRAMLGMSAPAWSGVRPRRAAGPPLFAATVSSEEVARGKPSPDVYLECAARLGVEAAGCTAVEDSANGIRSAHAAGMRVLALPNPVFPPGDDALALADAVLASLDALFA